MQVEEQNVMIAEHEATILCPMCGIQFQPKLSNVCEACMLAKTDITIGITK
jgi:NMD protein affecting ribosome stability and mRNA decay